MTDWAAYKAKQREARKEAGLKRVEVWAHPDDAEKIKALAGRLRKERVVENAQKKMNELQRRRIIESAAVNEHLKKLRKETR